MPWNRDNPAPSPISSGAFPTAASGTCTSAASTGRYPPHDGEPLSLVTGSGDEQLMFLVNNVSRTKPLKPKGKMGSRIAEVHNGSFLFTGDAGQGESNFRRWIIENDWLEAIAALPLNLLDETVAPAAGEQTP